MRLNQTLVNQLEELLREVGYRVRYEKGNFRGGRCVVEAQRLVVVNSFSPVPSRATTLIEVVLSLPIAEASLREEHRRLLAQLRRTHQPAATGLFAE